MLRIPEVTLVGGSVDRCKKWGAKLPVVFSADGGCRLAQLRPELAGQRLLPGIDLTILA